MDSLTPDEQAEFETLMEKGEEALYAETVKFKRGGTEHVHFHVDFMGGKSNEKYDALRMELGKGGGWCSVHFAVAADAPCDYYHYPKCVNATNRCITLARTTPCSRHSHARGMNG